MHTARPHDASGQRLRADAQARAAAPRRKAEGHGSAARAARCRRPASPAAPYRVRVAIGVLQRLLPHREVLGGVEAGNQGLRPAGRARSGRRRRLGSAAGRRRQGPAAAQQGALSVAAAAIGAGSENSRGAVWKVAIVAQQPRLRELHLQPQALHFLAQVQRARCAILLQLLEGHHGGLEGRETAGPLPLASPAEGWAAVRGDGPQMWNRCAGRCANWKAARAARAAWVAPPPGGPGRGSSASPGALHGMYGGCTQAWTAVAPIDSLLHLSSGCGLDTARAPPEQAPQPAAAGAGRDGGAAHHPRGGAAGA